MVHRDSKPGNIMLTRDGAKVLDFRLARTAPAKAAAASEGTALMTPPLTSEGMVMGTPQYMSPEQMEGREADARNDIFAFGCVLYEMITGRRAFYGKTRSSVIAATLAAQPPMIRSLQPVTPVALENIVAGCLIKEPDLRYQSLWDVLIELRRVSAVGEVVSVVEKRSWAPWVLASVFGFAALAAGAAWMAAKGPARIEPVQFQIEPPEEFAGHFAVSPNGRYVAMEAQRKLWIRDMGSLEAKVVDGVDDPTFLFWSPDSSSIGFWTDNKLKRVALAGNRVQTICDAYRVRGAFWSKEGVIVFSTPSGIRKVSAEGGTPAEVTRVIIETNDSHRYPTFLPDNDHFLFTYQSGKPEVAGIYLGSLSGSAPLRLFPDVGSAIYVTSAQNSSRGFVLFRRVRTLVAQPFDSKALRPSGEMFAVAEDVSLGANRTLGAFSASANGVLTFRSGVRQVEELAWVDRSGKRVGRIGERSDLNTFAVSKNESHVAVVRAETEKSAYQDDLWVQDVSHSAASRLTFGPEPGWSFPVWSPDSKDLIYSTSNAVGVTSYEIRRKAANMVGVNELLLRSDQLVKVWDVSPDGKWVLFSTDKLQLLPSAGADRKPITFSPTDAGQAFGQFSPDGRWIAYSGSDTPGRRYIYVQPFPATGAKWQISAEGALAPRWRKDGKELFFHTTDGQIMAASIKTDSSGSLEHGAPQALFPLAPTELYFHYQPSADGQRFLVLVPAAGEKPAPINVVLNWESEH